MSKAELRLKPITIAKPELADLDAIRRDHLSQLAAHDAEAFVSRYAGRLNGTQQSALRRMAFAVFAGVPVRLEDLKEFVAATPNVTAVFGPIAGGQR
jgi:hypothetical protein